MGLLLSATLSFSKIDVGSAEVIVDGFEEVGGFLTRDRISGMVTH